MNGESDSENHSDLVYDMTRLASSWLNCIEQIFKAFHRVSKRFSIEHDDSHNGRILNSEIIRCYAHCNHNVRKLDETFQPQQLDPKRINLASELIKEANAEWLEPISFEGYDAFTALEAAHHITDSLYSSDFQAITCWAEEREDAACELEEIRMFLDDFPELNTDFFYKLHFKLEQQQIITEKALKTGNLTPSKVESEPSLDIHKNSKSVKAAYSLKELINMSGLSRNGFLRHTRKIGINGIKDGPFNSKRACEILGHILAQNVQLHTKKCIEDALIRIRS
ncbi:hypothetical protein Mal35_26450 [Gimesia maris]|uniref:hypothetical protein n=1 Tax=Gimesia maris TaxID=122 RepID=UPI00118A4BA1|nr:hypothetical protein [Gimesia maris]QDT79190.1 hypothetical protein Mal35_26450 [Gimesia maris]